MSTAIVLLEETFLENDAILTRNPVSHNDAISIALTAVGLNTTAPDPIPLGHGGESCD